MKKIFIFFLCLFAVNCKANKADSLLTALKLQKEDTNKIRVLNELGWELMYLDPDTAIILGLQELALAEKLAASEKIPSKELKMLLADANGNLGAYHYLKSDYISALKFHNASLKISEEIGDKQGVAKALGNSGLIFSDQGNFPKALEYYFKALEIDEALGNKRGMGIRLCNIGLVYYDQADFSKALEYYERALNIDKETGNTAGIASDLANIGNIYFDRGRQAKQQCGCSDDGGYYRKALENYEEALKIHLETGNKKSEAICYGNIANIYDEMDEPKALEYYSRSLRLSEELGRKTGAAIQHANIGGYYTKARKYKEAEDHLEKALKLAEEMGALNITMQAEELMSDLYDSIGNIALSFRHYKKYIAARDSLNNEENIKKQTRAEMNFEFEKKQAEERTTAAAAAATAASELKRQKLLSYSVIVGLLLVAAIAVIIFRSLKISNRQKQIIEQSKEVIVEQKKKVEEKNKEIIDSITYAQRIQSAILAKEEEIKKHFPQSFLLYLPKDIVAGDFYFFETTATHIFYAAADCTGHGVPGAMVSVVCSNALTRCIREFNLCEPGKILDKARELVMDTFKKSGMDIKDGMDISLMCVKRVPHGEPVEFQWAGANNPLWYIHSAGQPVKLQEIKADKQPIGYCEEPKPFITHTIRLSPGSEHALFYLFTDGYPDQFGGPKGKKFKYKQVEELLVSVQHKSMPEQKDILHKTISAWKGELEQVDDICIIGVRI